jgi:acid phosphatase
MEEQNPLGFSSSGAFCHISSLFPRINNFIFICVGHHWFHDMTLQRKNFWTAHPTSCPLSSLFSFCSSSSIFLASLVLLLLSSISFSAQGSMTSVVSAAQYHLRRSPFGMPSTSALSSKYRHWAIGTRIAAGSSSTGSRLLGIRGGASSTSLSEAICGGRERLIQVQIIHRHGDRTPITPIVKQMEYWNSTLPQPQLLEKISRGIRLRRSSGSYEPMKHGARGNPPFGQLTSLGLFQMIQLGSQLREDLCCTHPNTTNSILTTNKLFTVDTPLHPSRIQARSTDFPRTIQSLQGLLVGLFPDGFDFHAHTNNSHTSHDAENHVMEVDLRNAHYHIPDPQPRHTKLQERLERQADLREHIQRKEMDMLPLAIKVTNDLLSHNYIQEHEAKQVSFGFNVASPSQEEPSSNFILPWPQLAEITKCLRVHNLLPPTITHEEQELILKYTSWKWFETLQHSKLGKLAMHHMMVDLLDNMLHLIREVEQVVKEEIEDDTYPSRSSNNTSALLHIYSAHDSTLIGLMCALQLTQPAEWPEYASYLKIELLALEEAENDHDEKTAKSTTTKQKKYYVRFSLNGTLLQCKIGQSNDNDDNSNLIDMIPLEKLQEFIHDLSHIEEHDEDMAKLKKSIVSS